MTFLSDAVGDLCRVDPDGEFLWEIGLDFLQGKSTLGRGVGKNRVDILSAHSNTPKTRTFEGFVRIPMALKLFLQSSF